MLDIINIFLVLLVFFYICYLYFIKLIPKIKNILIKLTMKKSDLYEVKAIQ